MQNICFNFTVNYYRLSSQHFGSTSPYKVVTNLYVDNFIEAYFRSHITHLQCAVPQFLVNVESCASIAIHQIWNIFHHPSEIPGARLLLIFISPSAGPGQPLIYPLPVQIWLLWTFYICGIKPEVTLYFAFKWSFWHCFKINISLHIIIIINTVKIS